MDAAPIQSKQLCKNVLLHFISSLTTGGSSAFMSSKEELSCVSKHPSFAFDKGFLHPQGDETFLTSLRQHIFPTPAASAPLILPAQLCGCRSSLQLPSASGLGHPKMPP